ncbi:MAG: hypothetical protein ACYSW8_33200 [Planctomycetota bacterium]
MSKPFLVINIVEGKNQLGVVREYSTHDEAIDEAIDMVLEQQSVENEEDVRNELSEDSYFAGTGFQVHIAQTED